MLIIKKIISPIYKVCVKQFYYYYHYYYYYYLFIYRQRGREEEGEKHQCVDAS